MYPSRATFADFSRQYETFAPNARDKRRQERSRGYRGTRVGPAGHGGKSEAGADQVGGRRRRQVASPSPRGACHLQVTRVCGQFVRSSGPVMDSPAVSESVWRAGRVRGCGQVRRCRSCGRALFGRGRVCRSRRCPEYGPVWAGDQRQKLFRNLEVLAGEILLSAVTAPGVDQLPWDGGVCAGLAEHEHAGHLGCRVETASAARWNRTAPDRWRRLHRRAYQDAVKRCGPKSVWLVARGRCRLVASCTFIP